MLKSTGLVSHLLNGIGKGCISPAAHWYEGHKPRPPFEQLLPHYP